MPKCNGWVAPTLWEVKGQCVVYERDSDVKKGRVGRMRWPCARLSVSLYRGVCSSRVWDFGWLAGSPYSLTLANCIGSATTFFLKRAKVRGELEGIEGEFGPAA